LGCGASRFAFCDFKTAPEINRLAMMIYIRFPLSLHNGDDLLHEHRIGISHETVRY
jgi:putative transposase